MKTLKNIAEVLFVYVCAAALSVAIFAVVLYGICPLAETRGCFETEKDNSVNYDIAESSEHSERLMVDKQKTTCFPSVIGKQV